MNKKFLTIFLLIVLMVVIINFKEASRDNEIVDCGNEIINSLERYYKVRGEYPPTEENKRLPNEILLNLKITNPDCINQDWLYQRYDDSNHFTIIYSTKLIFDSPEYKWRSIAR